MIHIAILFISAVNGLIPFAAFSPNPHVYSTYLAASSSGLITVIFLLSNLNKIELGLVKTRDKKVAKSISIHLARQGVLFQLLGLFLAVILFIYQRNSFLYFYITSCILFSINYFYSIQVTFYVRPKGYKAFQYIRLIDSLVRTVFSLVLLFDSDLMILYAGLIVIFNVFFYRVKLKKLKVDFNLKWLFPSFFDWLRSLKITALKSLDAICWLLTANIGYSLTMISSNFSVIETPIMQIAKSVYKGPAGRFENDLLTGQDPARKWKIILFTISSVIFFILSIKLCLQIFLSVNVFHLYPKISKFVVAMQSMEKNGMYMNFFYYILINLFSYLSIFSSINFEKINFPSFVIYMLIFFVAAFFAGAASVSSIFLVDMIVLFSVSVSLFLSAQFNIVNFNAK